jgi:hypothetical protein
MINVRPSTTLAFDIRLLCTHTDISGSRKISPFSRPRIAAATRSSSRRLLVFCASGRLLVARTTLLLGLRLCRTLLFRKSENSCRQDASEGGQLVDYSGKEIATLGSWFDFEYI